MSVRIITYLSILVLVCCAVTNGDTLSAKISENKQHIPLDTLSRYFRLSEEVGWQELTNGFHAFDTTRLYDLIDGGAVIYIRQGMLHGIYHRMTQSNGRRYDALVMDFATSKKASAMYREQRKQTGAIIQLGTYDTTEVSASDVLSGICVYGHFSSFYFELTLTGYKVQAESEKEAVGFIDLYKKQSIALRNKSKK